MNTEQENLNTKINFKGETFKKYFFNTSWMFFEKVFRIIINLVVGVYVLRFLGAENNGKLAFAVSIAGIIYAVSTLGLSSIISRELVKKPDSKYSLLGTAFYLKVLVSIVLFSSIVIYYQIKTEIDSLLVIIISASILFRTFDITESYFQSKVLLKLPVIVKSVSIIITDIFKVVLIFISADLIYFGVAISAEYILLGIGYLIILSKADLKIKQFKFNSSLAYKLIKDSWPLLFSSLAIGLYMKLDRVLIKYLIGNTELGIYDSAVRLCEGWFFIPVVICASLFPAIVKSKDLGQQIYKSRMQKLYDIMFLISILIAIPIAIFAKQIIYFLYTSDYFSGVPILVIYIWTSIPVFFGIANGQYLVAENMTKIYFLKTMVGLTFNFILNLILIPKYGIQGAAYATLISYSISVMMILFFKSTREQFIMILKAFNLFKYVKVLFSNSG